jgi:adenosylhomocysteine nucleosidase
MRIGIVGALEPEIRAFGRRRSRRPGGPRGDAVLRAVSGVGAERAYGAGRRLIDAGADALVSWGTAAALVPVLEPGSLLLPRKVIARDGTAFAVEGEWQQAIRERLSGEHVVHTAPLADAGEPLLSAADKRTLAQRSGAAAADMESAALAALASEAGIPLLVVRAVVDSADVAVPARLAAATRRDGSLSVASTLAWLASSPSQWLTALRLARGFRAALLTLERVAHEVHA